MSQDVTGIQSEITDFLSVDLSLSFEVTELSITELASCYVAMTPVTVSVGVEGRERTVIQRVV